MVYMTEFEKALSNLIAQNLSRNWTGRSLIVTEEDIVQAQQIARKLREQALSFSSSSISITESLISIGKKYGPGLVSPMIFAMASIEWQGTTHVYTFEDVIYALTPDWLEMPASPFFKGLGYTESFQTVYYISQCFYGPNWSHIGTALSEDFVRLQRMPWDKARQIAYEHYQYAGVLAAGALMAFLHVRSSLFYDSTRIYIDEDGKPLVSPLGKYVNIQSIKLDSTKSNRDLVTSIYHEMKSFPGNERPFFSTIYRDCIRYIDWWLELTRRYMH